MHVPLTISWITGLLITIGSLCRIDPAPWFWLGLGILVFSMIVLFREMRKIVGRNHELHDINLAELKVGRAAQNTVDPTSCESIAGPAI